MRNSDYWGIRPSQHGFTKGRSCLTNLISFYDLVAHLVDEGRTDDVVYLDFSKAFDTVSHRLLLRKLAAHSLDRYMLGWVKSWLEGWTQSVGKWSSIQLAASHECCSPGVSPVQYLYWWPE